MQNNHWGFLPEIIFPEDFLLVVLLGLFVPKFIKITQFEAL